MRKSKVHATEEHRDGRMEARERHHSSMDARSSENKSRGSGAGDKRRHHSMHIENYN